jgi:hypothetical protein
MATKKKARPGKAAKSGARKSARRAKPTGKAARRNATTRKPARKKRASKSATRKPAARKSAPRKSAHGTSTLRQSLARSLPREGVATAVKERARQGLELAREGFERLKDATVNVTATVVEGVKERISSDADRAPEPEGRGNGGVKLER